MKRKELIKTFMMISNWKNPFGLYGLYLKKSAVFRWFYTSAYLELLVPSFVSRDADNATDNAPAMLVPGSSEFTTLSMPLVVL